MANRLDSDSGFEALLEQSSLGTSGARRLRSRSSAADIDRMRRVRREAGTQHEAIGDKQDTQSACSPAQTQLVGAGFLSERLKRLVAIIVDQDGPYDRAGWQLERLLQDCGWPDPPAYDGTYRADWLLDLIEREGNRAAIERLICRVCDPLEYDEGMPVAEEFRQVINGILQPERLAVVYVVGRPVLRKMKQEGGGPRSLAERPPDQLHGYQGPTACQVAGITYRQLDYWARTGLVVPSIRGAPDLRLYSFDDLLALKMVKQFLDQRVPLRAIRLAMEHLHARSIHNLTSGRPFGGHLPGHNDPVLAVAIGRVGNRDVIVSGSFDGTVRIWDPATGEPVGSPLTGHTDAGHTDEVYAVAMGRVDDRDVIVSGGDATVRIWDLATGKPVGKPLTGHLLRDGAIADERASPEQETELPQGFQVAFSVPIGEIIEELTVTLRRYEPERVRAAELNAPTAEPGVRKAGETAIFEIYKDTAGKFSLRRQDVAPHTSRRGPDTEETTHGRLLLGGSPVLVLRA